jgi:hypothetical protein
MRCLQPLLIACLFLAGFIHDLPARAEASGQNCISRQPLWYALQLSPGIGWSDWSAQFGLAWSGQQISAKSWFDLASATRAAALYPTSPFDPGPIDPETYKPVATVDNAEDSALYRVAAALYHAGDPASLDKAIQAFDKIAGEPGSPYAAAAAYSAARASFYLGRTQEGLERISRLLDDPALREFHRAAYHLVGTLAYQYGSPPLIAARLAEISHLLTAPLELQCHDAQLADLVQEAEDDLGYMLGIAVPKDHWHYSEGNPSIQQTAWGIFAEVGAQDPLVDLARILAVPTPYIQDRGWYDDLPPKAADVPSYVDGEQTTREITRHEAEAATDYARQKWQATGNPLWAYALARRSADANDIALLDQALDTPHARLDTRDPGAAIAIIQHFVLAQDVRLRLISGKSDAALDLVRRETTAMSGAPNAVARQMDLGTVRFIRNGGARYFLERRDLSGARRWREEIGKIWPEKDQDWGLHGPTYPSPWESFATRSFNEEGLPLLLADSWETALSGMISGQDTNDRTTSFDALAFGMDLLPASRLVALSRTPGLSKDVRRGVLSAAWVRLYMLDRWPEFTALIPEIRDAFPELASDLDEISGAWTEGGQRRLVTRLLLRAPGLSPRIYWADRPARELWAARKISDIFSIDRENPNDGNWWSPLDLDRSEIDVMTTFFGAIIDPDRANDGNPVGSQFALDGGDLYHEAETKSRMAAEAKALIAWHPLFKESDFAELDRLSKVESAPRRLSEEAIAWADRSNWFTRLIGSDDHLAETLHLAVRSTRFSGRLAGPRGAYSRAAFLGLRRLYPNSPWAAKTPYWYN